MRDRVAVTRQAHILVVWKLQQGGSTPPPASNYLIAQRSDMNKQLMTVRRVFDSSLLRKKKTIVGQNAFLACFAYWDTNQPTIWGYEDLMYNPTNIGAAQIKLLYCSIRRHISSAGRATVL